MTKMVLPVLLAATCLGMLLPGIVGAQTHSTCETYLASDPNPSGVPPVSGPGADQRRAFLASGGKLVLIGSRYYAVWFPEAFFGSTKPVVVVDLHGTGGYPEAEWNDWYAALATRGYAFIGLAWGGGTPSAATDTEVYAAIKQMVAEVGSDCPISSATKWLMGFSVGSAMSFAVMIDDVADQKIFAGQIAISGAAISPLTTGKDVMHATVEANRSNATAVSGIRAWLYCGQLDYDHSWNMCDEMPNGRDFVNEHGGRAYLYRDANGSHHSLPTNSVALRQMLNYMVGIQPGTPAATLIPLMD